MDYLVIPAKAGIQLPFRRPIREEKAGFRLSPE
jgi:hypothetical protein